jgi:hypothetical protein
MVYLTLIASGSGLGQATAKKRNRFVSDCNDVAHPSDEGERRGKGERERGENESGG